MGGETPSQLNYALKLISEAENPEELDTAIHELRDLYGFANLVYLATHIPGRSDLSPVLFTTYNPEWVKTYAQQNYIAIDPVIVSGRNTILPIDWLSIDQQTAESRHFFSESKRYEVGRQGLSMPIFGPSGDRSLFTFTANVADEDWADFRMQYNGELYVIGQYVHERMLSFLGNRRVLKKVPTLSPREQECVQYLAYGVAPKNIASNLDLSEAAVRLYMKHARQKLGCATLMQAVIKAARFNIIDSV